MTQENTPPTYWNAQQLHPDVVAVFSSSLPLATATSQTPSAILLPQQTHTANVAWVTPDLLPERIDLNPSPLFPDTDALITDIDGLTIGVRTADCVPILLYAADIKAVAAIHAGWKGTLHGIVDNVIDMLTDRGCDPTKIHACFGPSICPQCYEVDPSLAQQFIDAGFTDSVISSHTIDPLTGNAFAQRKPHLDLVKVNFKRMINKGLASNNINTLSPCTRHSLSSISEDNDLLRNTINQCTINIIDI
jgi:YfiH family protein